MEVTGTYRPHFQCRTPSGRGQSTVGIAWDSCGEQKIAAFGVWLCILNSLLGMLQMKFQLTKSRVSVKQHLCYRFLCPLVTESWNLVNIEIKTEEGGQHETPIKNNQPSQQT